MRRLYSLFIIFLAFPFLIRADEPVPTETVIRLQVQPKPAPRPALRYQLLPELRDMNPGNPVQGFLMCFVGLDKIFNNTAMEKWGWDRWGDIPLKDLPLDKMRGYGDKIVTQAIYAARLDTPDWQVLIKIKSEEVKSEALLDLILPALQKNRQLAQLLYWRLRVEIADRRFDDALVTAQTMFVLARTLGECPSYAADLVGVAIEYLAIVTIDEMIGQPGSPNLFWALTDLPRPIVDLRKGLQGERIWLMNVFSKLDNKGPMTEDQLHLVLNNMKSLDSPTKNKKESLASVINEIAKDKKQVQAARRRLIEAGLTEAMVKQFSDLQVILVDGKIVWENNQDEAIAVLSLPFWQNNALFAKSPQTRDHAFARSISYFLKVQRGQARTEQRVALLCCVEALRNYAAEHDGKLPSRLEDIKLPLPVDPITGQAFRYKLEAGTGHFRGSPPPGMEKSPFFNIHYEVTIRK